MKFLFPTCLMGMIVFFVAAAHAGGSENVSIYHDMCDASAALAIDESHFIVANDEDNVLRIYRLGQEFPVYKIDLSEFLRIEYDDKSPEADFEGAARINDIYFFITSHGRDKEGRMRRNRHRFFALQIKIDDKIKVNTIGRAYEFLMDDLVQVPQLQRVNLADAYDRFDDKDKDLAPKDRGVNIEGLAPTADDRGLLIGFRNPLPEGKAMIVEFFNPLQVLAGAERPSFGEAYFLDLNQRGVRSLDYLAALQRHLIVAGSTNGGLESELYLWNSGGESAENIEQTNFGDIKKFNPEAVVQFENNPRFLLLSDDGTVNLRDKDGDTCDCKDVSDDALKQFRGVWLSRQILHATP